MRRVAGCAIALLVVGGALAAAFVVYTVAGNALGSFRDSISGMDAPVSDDPTPVLFVVEPGQNAAEIGAALEREKLVRSARVFRMLVEREGVGHRLAAGEYELSRALSTGEIVAVLASGRVRRPAGLTVLEGWRAEEIAWRLDELQPGAGVRFLELVYDGEQFRGRLGLPPGTSLEGFLFPDTYEWQPGQPVEQLVDRMIGQFARRFDGRLRQHAAQADLSMRDAVTLASIIEREAAVPEERPLIAAVYYNRLARGMPLQADPTVQYALAEVGVPAPGPALWKRELSGSDLALRSPYNTYVVEGLPPGPICNPGLASLEAAVRPAQSDALFFVARGDGTHVFARTADEHVTNVRRYQTDPN